MDEQLLNKLRYREGRTAVLNAPAGYSLGIEADSEAVGTYDFVLVFVNDAQEAEAWIHRTFLVLNKDALYWIAFPKQSSKVKSDINRDSLAALVQNNTPYRPVSNVAIDDKWSALRFRPKDQVKSK